MKIEELKKLVEPILIVKILEVSKHPNADKLNLVKIDMGKHGQKTCITGAPNISQDSVGSFVPYLGEGHTIPGYLAFENEIVTLGKRMLRGIESDSMLLSEYEIGLSKSHEGLMILDKYSNIKNMVGESILNILVDEDFSALQNLANPEKEENNQ